MSLVDYGSSSGGESGPEAEGEAAVGSSSGRRRLSPARSRARKRRGDRDTVQIPVPELQSDSDDEEPVQKRASQGSGSGLGLSALLPQPRNLTLKETNRTLLPYSFTKAQKPAGKGAGSLKATSRATVTTTPSPSAIKAASKSAAKQLARHIMNEEASDDEEEEGGTAGQEVSFFSLSDAERPPPGTRTELFAGEGPLPGLPQVPSPAPGVPGEAGELTDPLNPADAPLEFNRNLPSVSDGGYPAASTSPANPGAEFSTQYVEYGAPGAEQSEYYQDYYSGYYQEPDPALAPVPEEELNTFMNDEAFKRLQGKRNRSKEEVSFLEIKGDDQLSGSQQWLIKSLSEEKDMKSFSKKRGEQPTSQQRRKHQITYLIHQVSDTLC
ncbi:proline-rich protein PRCC, partial [Mustelus asterias]